MIALSPLLDERSVRALLHLRARGFDLAVVELSPLAFVEPGPEETEQLAYRLWTLQREALRAQFMAAGDHGRPVAGGRAARGPARGGDEITALRPARARLILGGGASPARRPRCVRGGHGRRRRAPAGARPGLRASSCSASRSACRLAVPRRRPRSGCSARSTRRCSRCAATPSTVARPLYGACFLVVAELAYGALRAPCGDAGARPHREANRHPRRGSRSQSVLAGRSSSRPRPAPLGGGVALEAVGVVAAVALLVGLGPDGPPLAMNVAVVGSLSLDPSTAARPGSAAARSTRPARCAPSARPAVDRREVRGSDDRQLLLPPLDPARRAGRLAGLERERGFLLFLRRASAGG